MFEGRKTPQQISTDETTTVVPAAGDFSVFSFAPKPTEKPSMPVLQTMIRETAMPVVAFRIKPDAPPEPVTVVPLPIGERFLFLAPNNANGRIVALDDPAHTIYQNFDQYAAWLLGKWRVSRNLAAVEPPPVQGTRYAVEPGLTQTVIPATGFHV